MLKKSLLCLLVATSVNAKEVSGTGEFRFGPETSQNIACSLAEQKAKENAIANFVGEYIEHQTNQICRDEQCTEFRTLFSETSGSVKNVIDKNVLVAPERGYSVCIVDLKAQIEKITNTIRFTLEGRTQFKHGDRFTLTAVSNRAGTYTLFSVTNDSYQKVYSGKVFESEKQFQIPNPTKKLETFLPVGMSNQVEKIVLFFTTNDLTANGHYSRMEFNQMVNSIPFDERRVMLYPINIVR